MYFILEDVLIIHDNSTCTCTCNLTSYDSIIILNQNEL